MHTNIPHLEKNAQDIKLNICTFLADETVKYLYWLGQIIRVSSNMYLQTGNWKKGKWRPMNSIYRLS